MNAFLRSHPAPAEYGLVASAPEPWEGWHCIAAMRQRGYQAGAPRSRNPVLRVIWQFQFYLETDLYYVIATALRCTHLQAATRFHVKVAQRAPGAALGHRAVARRRNSVASSPFAALAWP